MFGLAAQTTLGTNTGFSLGVLKEFIGISKGNVFDFKEIVCHWGERL